MKEEWVAFLMEAREAKHLGKLEITEGEKLASKQMDYQRDNMKYQDFFFGLGDFSGSEMVWADDEACWSRSYLGRVLRDEFDEKFYHRMCLKAMYDIQAKGAIYYIEGVDEYKRIVKGTLDFFQGHEMVFHSGVQVYACYFQGGIVGK